MAGGKLTDEEQKYLDRALQELRKPNDKVPDSAKPAPGSARSRSTKATVTQTLARAASTAAAMRRKAGSPSTSGRTAFPFRRG